MLCQQRAAAVESGESGSRRHASPTIGWSVAAPAVPCQSAVRQVCCAATMHPNASPSTDSKILNHMHA